MIAEPPFEAGGVKLTVSCPLPAVAVPIVGAPGGPIGVPFAVPEAALVPAELVALTEQPYVVPFVSP